MKLSCFFLKVNKIDRSLARLRKKRLKSEIKDDTLKLMPQKSKIIKDYYEQLSTNQEINCYKYISYQD